MPLHTSLRPIPALLSACPFPAAPAPSQQVPCARLAAWGMACCALLSMGLQAQSLHRTIGPDGRVTYSDRAPSTPPASSPPANPPSHGGAARNPSATATGTPTPDTTARASGALPYALQQTSQRYPVTLYTTPNCAPCDSARRMLVQRGVPYTERTVLSDADLQAFQRLSGQEQLPFATIGQQHLQGWEAGEWQRYLDLAGYPATSTLPPRWQAPPATPLAPGTAMAAPSAPTSPAISAPTSATTTASPPDRPAAPTLPAAPRGPTPSNPAGIVF